MKKKARWWSLMTEGEGTKKKVTIINKVAITSEHTWHVTKECFNTEKLLEPINSHCHHIAILSRLLVVHQQDNCTFTHPSNICTCSIIVLEDAYRTS